MSNDQRWRWAGIASVIGIGGVLITDIVGNVVGGYISDQIKIWQVPGDQGDVVAVQPSEAVAGAASTPSAAPQQTPATAERDGAEDRATAEQPRRETVAMRDPLPGEPEAEPEAEPEPEPAPLPEPSALPAPPIQPLVLNGPVEKVIDTGTLKIAGETVLLAGVKGLGSPYRDQLAKFIEEQGSEVQCTPAGVRHTCFVSNVDLALAALTNGAARLAPDAPDQYRAAEEEARRNHRGIFR